MSPYPKDINIYGSSGNTLTIRRRLGLYGYEPIVHQYNRGDDWLSQVGLILEGGGQDTSQKKIIDDSYHRVDLLCSPAADGTPVPMIYGLYQLFGEYFEAMDGTHLDGISVIDVYAVGQNVRMVGSLVGHPGQFGDMTGYESCSSQTSLRRSIQPLGTVNQSSQGNNDEDHTEGMHVYNMVDTYMHGPLLSRNPVINDFLIETAMARRYGMFGAPNQIPEQAEELARLD